MNALQIIVDFSIFVNHMASEHSLAPTNRLDKMIVPGLMLAGLTVVLYYTGHQITSRALMVCIVVAYLVLITLIIKGYKSYDIYYDSESLHLHGHKETITIPYSNVKRLKMLLGNMTIMGMKRHQYKIEYLNLDGEASEISFWILLNDKDLEQFADYVKEANASVKIEHWATSADY